MLLISYDISNDKVRTKFSKYLSKFGFRLQYSVFEITNSDTVLKNIEAEIQNTYMKTFTEEDSIIIFNLSETCKKTCYGYATLSNANTNIIFVSSSHGRGVAYNNETGEEVFMRMKEVGIGLGAGAREYDLIFVFDNKEAWYKFISGQTKFGGEASATATDGKSGGALEGASLASSGIWVYQMTTKGISLEATLNGTKYYTDKKLNKKEKKN